MGSGVWSYDCAPCALTLHFQLRSFPSQRPLRDQCGGCRSECGRAEISRASIDHPFWFKWASSSQLSAWAARKLHEKAYHTEVKVAWVPKGAKEGVIALRQGNRMPFDLPKNLWKRLLSLAGIDPNGPFHSLTNLQMETLTTLLEAMRLQLEGKTTTKRNLSPVGASLLKKLILKPWRAAWCQDYILLGRFSISMGSLGGLIFKMPGPRVILLVLSCKC